MFKNWKEEKATTALVDEAQILADKLATAKPHILDSQTAYAQFWAASHLLKGQDLRDMLLWKPAVLARFIATTETKIASLRKQRDYESSDGLTIWLHTARALKEPRILPAVREIWKHIMAAGPNGDTMADDLFQDAGLPPWRNRDVPQGFRTDD